MPQLLHTMLRVRNLERSITFYTEILGMSVLRRSDNAEYRYTLAFVGYGPETEGHTVIELTYNWDINDYEMGDAFGHLAIGYDDIYQACDTIRAAGGTICREPGPVLGGSTHIAFVEDPDSYKIELIQRAQADQALSGN